MGTIYTGRDWTFRDNVIHFNAMHDIYGPGNGEAIVFYLDDCVSGITVYGNLVVNTQLAVGIGGGRDCLVENNIFVDTPTRRCASMAAVWTPAQSGGIM